MRNKILNFKKKRSQFWEENVRIWREKSLNFEEKDGILRRKGPNFKEKK